jgi:hypothetical protein
MAEGQDKKEFQQFDCWRAKVCLLDLHTRGQCPKENILQNAYMATLLVNFGAKSFPFQQKFGQDKNGIPNYGQEEDFFFHLNIQNLTRSKPKSWALI